MAASQEVEAAHRVMDYARGRGLGVANSIDDLRRKGLSWRAVLAEITSTEGA